MNSNKAPLVSIIVITYNSEKFVLDTLESAKSQTYQNIELIISDDGSSDKTINICNKWLEENKRRFICTKLITTDKNSGIAANLNRGVSVSNGEWFKLVAGDDILINNCIELNLNYINTSKFQIDIVNSPKISFKRTTDLKNIIIEPKEWDWPLFFYEKISALDQLKLAVRYIRPSINGHFIKKYFFEKIGGCDENYPMHEDRPLLIKILKEKNKIHGLKIPTVFYRVHENSVFKKDSKRLIYTDWFFNSYIPVIENYYYPYLTKIEVFSYMLFFSYARLIRFSCFNENNNFNRYFNNILKTILLSSVNISKYLFYYFFCLKYKK